MRQILMFKFRFFLFVQVFLSSTFRSLKMHLLNKNLNCKIVLVLKLFQQFKLFFLQILFVVKFIQKLTMVYNAHRASMRAIHHLY